MLLTLTPVPAAIGVAMTAAVEEATTPTAEETGEYSLSPAFFPESGLLERFYWNGSHSRPRPGLLRKAGFLAIPPAAGRHQGVP